MPSGRALAAPNRSREGWSRSGFGFRRVTKDDLPLLRQWLSAAHVRRWWGDPARELADIADALTETGVEPYIVSSGERPIGYLQSYDLRAAWALGQLLDQPAGTVGIDQFIGEADMVGKGHGPRFIAAACEEFFDAGAPRVVTDPDPANRRAVRAYEKAGFRPLDERSTIDGPVVLMARDRAN